MMNSTKPRKSSTRRMCAASKHTSGCGCGCAPPPQPPPWTVLLLVSLRLDPRTLATASCVSESWRTIMFSDNLWKPICLSHFPSFSSLPLPTASSYRDLFAVLRHSSNRCRLRDPQRPRIGLHHLLLTVDVFSDGVPVISVAKSGEEFGSGPWRGAFHFDAGIGKDTVVAVEEGCRLRVVWTVVMKGSGSSSSAAAAFLVMDSDRKKGSWAVGREVWFSEDLPASKCCVASASASGLVAEVVMGVGGASRSGDGRAVEVGSLSLGLLSVSRWAYLSVDDGMRYLQHFLL